jgi:hypothetical protein
LSEPARGRQRSRRATPEPSTTTYVGTVALYLNGHYWRSVNLHSTATHVKAIVVLPAFALHDTSIAVRTTGTKLVVIDGLGVSRT